MINSPDQAADAHHHRASTVSNASSDAITIDSVNAILQSHGDSNGSGSGGGSGDPPSGSTKGKWDMEMLMEDTESLRSFVAEHAFEYGRRYARNTNWLFPNDESESARLDLVHHIYLLLLEGELVVSPIKNPEYILDVGCGTGIWCIDAGDKYPDATIIGTDVTPIQPEWVPPNVAFQIDDAELDWNFAHPFDLIHVRYMRGAISDWPRFYRQTYLNLKPGGYAEFVEPELECYTDDNSLPPDADLHRFTRMYHDATTRLGRKTKDLALTIPTSLREAGFVDVTSVVKKVPCNVWPKSQRMKELGAFSLMSCLDGADGQCLKLFTAVYGWTVEQVWEFTARLKRELKNPRYHIYFKYHFITARKPEVDGGGSSSSASDGSSALHE